MLVDMSCCRIVFDGHGRPPLLWDQRQAREWVPFDLSGVPSKVSLILWSMS